MEIAYVYDGSFEGLLTAVFLAYQRKERPYTVAVEENLQIMFGQELLRVDTDEILAERVRAGLIKTAGEQAYETVWTAFLSQDLDKAVKIYRFIRLAMKLGPSVSGHLSHPDVGGLVDVNRHTGNEAHLLKGFVRFALLENGVYYARIDPKNNVLPLIMPHFSERYSDQPFLIFDPGHQLAGVYDLKEWYLVPTDSIDLPELAEGEREWHRLWKGFYNTIAIPERKNHKLRMNLMPKRYWRNMLEMNDLA